jgi:hypothetical protein
MTGEDKLLLTIYYMGKMAEGGFSTAGPGGLTSKGFDIAMDLIESGEKVSLEDMKVCLIATGYANEKEIDEFALIMFEIQERGFKEVMKRVEDIKNKE